MMYHVPIYILIGTALALHPKVAVVVISLIVCRLVTRSM